MYQTVKLISKKFFIKLLHRFSSRGVKTVFFYKTGNRFVETGNLPVIGVRDVMCHVAAVLHR